MITNDDGYDAEDGGDGEIMAVGAKAMVVMKLMMTVRLCRCR